MRVEKTGHLEAGSSRVNTNDPALVDLSADANAAESTLTGVQPDRECAVSSLAQKKSEKLATGLQFSRQKC